MNKNEVVLTELEKIAVSLQARNNKNYWGILKRLHGGTENTMSALSKDRRNMFVMHADTKPSISKAMKYGINPGLKNVSGDGSYFVGKDSASHLPSEMGLLRLKTPTEATSSNLKIPRRDIFKKIDIDRLPPTGLFIDKETGFKSIERSDILNKASTNRRITGSLESYGRYDNRQLADTFISYMHTHDNINPAVLKKVKK